MSYKKLELTPIPIADEETIVGVQCAALEQCLGTHPFQSNIWGRPQGILQHCELDRALQDQRYEGLPWSISDEYRTDNTWYDHPARIAYLIAYPDPSPLSIEIGPIGLVMHDGHHRFAAALHQRYRTGTDTVLRIALGGFVDDAPFRLLPDPQNVCPKGPFSSLL